MRIKFKINKTNICQKNKFYGILKYISAFSMKYTIKRFNNNINY